MQQKFFRENLIATLASGGDSRLTIDPRTGTNKYLCPSAPVPGLVVASSCTASPISLRGLARAADVFGGVLHAATPAARADRIAATTHRIARDLLDAFAAADLADVVLCPSGTDALLTAAERLAAEQPDLPITAILPRAAETGTGVPLAAAGRWFDGPRQGEPVGDHDIATVEIPLRDDQGAPLAEEAVNRAYAAAASAVRGRAVVVLTDGTKTGLIAPSEPPAGADVIVDACQTRLAPATVARYLRRGWPVVITGSKFFGGPPFSGALFWPKSRRLKSAGRSTPALAGAADNLGMVLRWVAAVDTIQMFARRSDEMDVFLRARGAGIVGAIAANPALVPIAGAVARGRHWHDQPSIFTFAVRDPADERRLLSTAALKPVHAALAAEGILLGQPVSLGAFGGLRVALGARDLLDATMRDNFPRLLAALERLDPAFPPRATFGPLPLPAAIPARPVAVLADLAGP